VRRASRGLSFLPPFWQAASLSALEMAGPTTTEDEIIMSAEKIAALEAEVARLKQKLEEPDVQVNFGVAMLEGAPRLTVTTKNVGVLPANDLTISANLGQLSYEFKLENGPPWPLLPGESRMFWAGPQAVDLLKAAQPSIVVVKSRGKVIKETPAADLAAMLNMLK
jgi:hypothetical protein